MDFWEQPFLLAHEIGTHKSPIDQSVEAYGLGGMPFDFCFLVSWSTACQPLLFFGNPFYIGHLSPSSSGHSLMDCPTIMSKLIINNPILGFRKRREQNMAELGETKSE